MKKSLLVMVLISILTLLSFGQNVVLTIAAGAVGQEFELCQEAAVEFMKIFPGITVKVLETPDLATDRLGLYLQFFEAKSSEVDVYQIDVIWPGDLAQHFVDLYQYGAHDYVGNHFPAIIQNNTVDGKLIGMPWFTDAGLLFYRTDLLKKYGYDHAPATWDELEAMAKVVQAGERKTNPDFWGFVFQANAYEGLTCDALEWIVSNGGGAIISPDKKITIANKNAAEILEKVRGWIGTIAPKGVLGFGEEDARGVFQGGNALFMRNWPYAYSLGEQQGSVIRGKFGAAPLPAGKSGKGAAALGGWQVAVSKYSKNPALAAQLAFFLSNYSNQKIRAIKGSYNPTVMSLYQDADVLKATPIFGSLYNVFINAAARPSTASAPRYNEVSTLFFKAVHKIISGGVDAMDTLEALALDLKDVTGFEIVWE